MTVQLLHPDTYFCSDLALICQCGGFRSCITSYSLSLAKFGSDYPISLFAPQHIFKLAYPPRGLVTACTIEYMKPLDFSLRHIIVLLHPESIEGDANREPAQFLSPGVESFINHIVPCATDGFANKISLVAIDDWPPHGPRDLRQSTPHTTAKAFQAA